MTCFEKINIYVGLYTTLCSIFTVPSIFALTHACRDIPGKYSNFFLLWKCLHIFSEGLRINQLSSVGYSMLTVWCCGSRSVATPRVFRGGGSADFVLCEPEAPMQGTQLSASPSAGRWMHLHCGNSFQECAHGLHRSVDRTHHLCRRCDYVCWPWPACWIACCQFLIRPPY